MFWADSKLGVQIMDQGSSISWLELLYLKGDSFLPNGSPAVEHAHEIFVVMIKTVLKAELN